MTKEQQIEEMANDIPRFARHGSGLFLTDCEANKAIARELVEKGYGNLREFVEKLKRQCELNSDAVGGCGGYCVSPYEIDQLLKEYEK